MILLVLARTTRADEVIVVHGDGPRGGSRDLVGDDPAARDRRKALADPPFVTRIHVDAHDAEQATLADVVAGSVGVHVRSLGGLGGFSSLSVRGAASGQTAVLIDGVPLSRIASITADLGAVELDAIDEVVVYRGGTPAALGGAVLGGALALETRLGRGPRGEQVWLSLGGGSFGARHLRARYGLGDPDEGTAATFAVGYGGATGDFSYFDDGGTNLDPDDDRYVARSNNGYDHVDATARAGGDAWVAGARGLWRRQGLPGSAFDPAAEARLDTASVIADGGWTRGALGVGGWALVERQRFVDRDAEIGLGAEERRYLTLGAGGSASWTVHRGRHAGTAALELRGDRFRDEDVLGGGPRVVGDRLAAGLSLSDDIVLAGGRWVIEPAVRLDAMRTDPVLDRYLPGNPEAPVRTDLAPSPRVAARVLATHELAIKASAGWAWRAPTVLELYGDRGFVVGSPDLRPERGPTADLGAVWAPARARGAVDRIVGEAAVFGSMPRDTIALVSSGALVARPLNVGNARIAGAEASATARIARLVTFAANYTFLYSAQDVATPSYDGKPLPQRPRHELYGRVDVARTLGDVLGVVWADASVVAGNYLDQAALNEVPARRLFGAGVKIDYAGFTVGVEVKNLLDNRIERVALDPPPRPDLTSVPRAVADVAGYPLPGRAVYASVEWRR